MPNEMSRMNATVREHMHRDSDAGGQWVCTCEDCRQMRALIGVEKMVEVRPLVRKIAIIEEQITALPDDAERKALNEEYLALLDRLAEVVAE